MRFQTNFLREREQQTRRAGTALSVVLVVLVLIFLANIVMYFTYRDRAGEASKQEALLENQIRQYEQEVKAGPDRAFLARFKGEVAFANSLILRKSFSWTSLLGRIEKAVPKGISVTKIAPDFKTIEGKEEEEVVMLSGTARSLEALTGLIINLEDSVHFREVFLLNQSLRDDKSGRELIAFDIRMQYLPGGEEGGE
ncbi:MAG: PilN domain-containing protein [Nitrospirota bacterium]|nr:PilN domain-containing protein [Nitrospirota bacterium]